MKLGMNDILGGIEYAAKQKIAKTLEREGFSVYDNIRAEQNDRRELDLYAVKGEDRRIYELKIGKNRIQQRQYLSLQEAAKKLNAKLYIIYLEIPRSKEIEFEGLEQIILEDLLQEVPNEIDSLSTHTIIDSVDGIDLDSIHFSDGLVKISGSGILNVNLQYGSRSDLRNNDAIEGSSAIGFFFKLSINAANNVVSKRYYKFDTI